MRLAACGVTQGIIEFECPFALSMSKGTTLRLARYFGTDAKPWLNLQLSCDLKITETELNVRIDREVEEMVA